jgi:hypothetical protein
LLSLSLYLYTSPPPNFPAVDPSLATKTFMK